MFSVEGAKIAKEKAVNWFIGTLWANRRKTLPCFAEVNIISTMQSILADTKPMPRN